MSEEQHQHGQAVDIMFEGKVLHLTLFDEEASSERIRGALLRNLFDRVMRSPDRRGKILKKVFARCEWVDRGSKFGPCLEWQGPDSGKPGRGQKVGRGHSYARMCIDGVTAAVHRVVWITLNGFLPSKKQLDHLCSNRKCVLHCEPVTHKQNQRRRDRARKNL